MAHILVTNENGVLAPGLFSLEEVKGLQVTRQGLRVYQDELITRSDPRGVPYYWLGGDPPTGIPDQGTDFGALKAGFASLTPLNLDLTAGAFMEPLGEIFSKKLKSLGHK